MTSIWSNAECIYSMPKVGPTKTTTTISAVSDTATAQFSLSGLWPSGGELLGKSLLFRAGGTFNAGAVTNLLQVGFGATAGTLGTALAASGAITIPSSTVGMWSLFLEATCVTVGANTSGWTSDGWIDYGVNAATTATLRYTAGGSNTLGVPNTVAIVPSTLFNWELFSTFGTAPTAFVASRFKIYAEN